MRPPISIRQYNPNGLSDDEIRHYAPSVFASRPWHEVSARYQFISTETMLNALRQEGFVCVGAGQTRRRDPEKNPFTQHYLRLRTPQVPGWKVGDIFPEVIVENSHDRSGQYSMVAAFWRYWCANGCATNIGEQTALKMRHAGSVSGIVDAALMIAQEMPKISETIESWQHVTLTEDDRLRYAEAARKLRWTGDYAPISPIQLLAPRRFQDAGKDLFTTYQVVEENIVKGGLLGRASTNRRLTTRPIQSLKKDLVLNKNLWTLTEEYAQQKAA